MFIEVIGVDHAYIAVSDLARSTIFYDAVMRLLGFRKGTKPVGGQPHVHYFNRVFQYTLRPAKLDAPPHDPLVPGLHHLCFQVADRADVDVAADGLRQIGIVVSEPRLYPQYESDYYAIYFNDPDGIELEIVNRVHRREVIVEHWEKLTEFENPLSKAGLV
ncbi:MAG: VOC family protein [Akkermansiaceae bacterium]|nr:VOC family protein [Armatimonadota bacterium]